MRVLDVFPHPDDEAFGPSRAIAAQRRQGHEPPLTDLVQGLGEEPAVAPAAQAGGA